ncbi:hypothetical protein Scep_008061 [Stephania cephalantha]|uniref:Uncharacterized protein n=1 Tax=Stephania cephalantha TaxID=152367 RepID=A0AAP0PNT6_9MAGN
MSFSYTSTSIVGNDSSSSSSLLSSISASLFATASLKEIWVHQRGTDGDEGFSTMESESCAMSNRIVNKNGGTEYTLKLKVIFE